MEQIENQADESSPATEGLHISNDARAFWPGTRNWTLFLGIISLIGAGFVLLILVVIIAMSPEAHTVNMNRLHSAMLVYGLAFLVLAGFGVMYIWISNKIGQAARFLLPQALAQYTGSVRLYFILAGILSILAVLVQIVSLMVVTGD